MNNPLVVFVDVDGVVADLGPEWVRRYNADYDDTLCYHTGITGWDMSAAVKPECGKKIFDYLHAADLYDGVQPIPDALFGVQALREQGYRVVFATSTNVHQAGNKLRWLARHGFLELKYGSISGDYIEVHDKHLLRGFALIDDGPHNLVGFVGRRILFHANHNAAHEDASFERYQSWAGVATAFRLSNHELMLLGAMDGILKELQTEHAKPSPDKTRIFLLEHKFRNAQNDLHGT